MKFAFRTVTLVVTCLLFYVNDSFAAKNLNLWLMPNGTYPEKTMRKYLDIFESENPDVKVTLRILDWGEAWTLLEKMAAEKTGPDVVQLGTTWVPYFAQKGVLLDLKTEISNYGGVDAYHKPAWPTTHRFGVDETISLPWFLDTRLILANKKYFDSLKYTTADFDSWESFKGALVKFQKANMQRNNFQVWPLTHSGIGDWNVVHNFAPWIWSGGGSFIEEKDGQFFSNIRNPGTVKGIREYISYALDGLVEKSDLQKNMIAVETKMSETRAFIGVWTSFIFLQQQAQANPSQLDKDGGTPIIMPKGPGGRYSFLGGSNLAVTSFSPDIDNAKKLLAFMVRDTIQAKYCSEIGTLSGRSSTTQASYVKNKDYYNTLLENVKYGRSYPNTPEWGKVEIVLNKGLERIWMLVQGVYGEFNEKDFLAEIDSLDAGVNKALGIAPEKAAELYKATFAATQPVDAAADKSTDKKSSNKNTMIIISIALAALIVTIVAFTSRKKKKEPSK